MLCIICKKNKSPLFNFNKLNYCTNHAKLLVNKFVILIQKIYRGYRRRIYLKNIFYRLPRELQQHILNFNNQNIKKLYACVNSYILKKTYKIKSLSHIEDNEITLDELINIITSISKYYYFLEPKWLNYYKFYFNNIKAILVSLVYKKTVILNIIIYNSLNFYTNLLNNNFNKIALVLISKINTFNHLIKSNSNPIT
jgi:hypothetical protein